MSLAGLGWLFVLGVLVHNAEEAVFLPSWPSSGRWRMPRVSPGAFRFAASVLGAFFCLAATLATLRPQGTLPANLMAGAAFAMAVNAWVPHLAVSMKARRLMPGTLTGVFLNLPLGTVYILKAVGTGRVRPGTLVWAGPLVALGLLGSLPVLFWAGRLMTTPGAGKRDRSA
jgi:Na+(H+)/acetate symporter ActP